MQQCKDCRFRSPRRLSVVIFWSVFVFFLVEPWKSEFGNLIAYDALRHQSFLTRPHSQPTLRTPCVCVIMLLIVGSKPLCSNFLIFQGKDGGGGEGDGEGGSGGCGGGDGNSSSRGATVAAEAAARPPSKALYIPTEMIHIDTT